MTAAASSRMQGGATVEEKRSGVSVAELLLSRIGGAELQDVYLDEDEEGRFLGLVFTDGETEYHLTFEEDGTIQLAEGPLEGESLEEVVTFGLDEVVPPYSDEGSAQA